MTDDQDSIDREFESRKSGRILLGIIVGSLLLFVFALAFAWS